jgi:hypothetical protein
LVGLANDLGLSESNIAPMQDISMPLDSVMSILSGGDTSTSSLMQAANLPIADATDNAATLLALTDMPSTLSDALSDAGNLLGGGDVLNATAASTADAAAASLPAPVITAPVSQLLSGLFHH